MKPLCIALSALSLLALAACSTVDERGDPRMQAAHATDAQPATKPAKSPWDYHSYPFGE
jgi:hypothetical protein